MNLPNYPYFTDIVYSDTLLRLNTALIISYQNKILLDLRSDNHQWGLLGGQVNLGESPQDAIKREIYEESGIPLFDHHLELLGVYGDVSDFRIVHYPEGTFHIVDIIFYHKLDKLPTLIVSAESLRLSFFDLHNLPWSDILIPARKPLEDYINSLY